MTEAVFDRAASTATTPHSPLRSQLLLAPARIARTGPATPLDRIEPHVTESRLEHLSRIGPRMPGGLWLIAALQQAQLTGHGGGHFPVARKWRSVLGAPDLTVVANGAESESLSAKDATLLRQRPHLVLDGLHCALETVGARRGVVWLHESDPFTRRVVEHAIEERRSASVTEAETKVVVGPDTYLAGEASAIVQGLSGGPVLPTYRGTRARSFRAEHPTALVHNVETLARVALVTRERNLERSEPSECCPSAPRSTLVTVLTPIDRQVVELSSTSTLQAVLSRTTWLGPQRPKSVLLGGFGGMWAPWTAASGLELNERAMRRRGLTLGPGVVAPFPEDICGVAETARIIGYLAASSAHQCGPCIFGLSAMASSLESLRTGSARRGELHRLRGDLKAVEGRGACHHPDGAARLVATALEAFSSDFDMHTEGRPCAFTHTQAVPIPGGP
jgi:NADH:ubiquinone oxidoreductase subunit F (NADH-binding)